MLFGAQTVAYLFLGGTGGGILLASCLWALWFHRAAAHPRTRVAQPFDRFFRQCAVVGLVTLAVALLCLVGDLGRPDRVLYLFATEHANVLTVGAYSLGLELLLAAALAVGSFAWPESRRQSRTARRTLQVLRGLCAAFGLVVIVYTGVYLYSLEAVAFWHHPAIIAVFLFSSLSSGISATLLVGFFNQNQWAVLGTVKPLQRLHIALVVCEAVSIAAFLWQAAADPASAASLATLQSAAVAPTAIIGVGLMALAVPLTLESVAVASRGPRHIPASDVLCIVGCLMLRYVIVLCGAH